MFGRFFQKPSPLYDRLFASTPDKLEQLVESKKEADNALAITISMMNMCGAGHFLRSSYPDIRKSLREANKDIVAFEALAFFTIALRHAYVEAHREPVDDPLDDDLIDLPEYLDDAFGFARGVSMSIAVDNAAWRDAEHVFKKRLVEYATAGRKGAAERFRFILQSIGKASAPAINYGPLNLDLMQGLQAMAAVNAFAANMPAGYAETLHRVIEMYGFDR